MANENYQVQKINYEQHDYYQLDDNIYDLVLNHNDAFVEEELSKRYSDILAKYDFIVGDWSYEQLRLKGFYYDQTKHIPIDLQISHLEDYLLEYCSFGCAYFVLERVSGQPFADTQKQVAHIQEKKYKIKKRKGKYHEA